MAEDGRSGLVIPNKIVYETKKITKLTIDVFICPANFYWLSIESTGGRGLGFVIHI